ncbi:hypothetical protein BDV95DRAFT_22471 [Massariosphaeria phaeospora]|uniref:Uncharacterized protein n=1 Tax=Massariosphaeria phaeospora TaxID=100035 RepID=A0A7C8MHI2_9PLEO|nr:hypothetical protein BDV95DRAFT_22471 [Massariosphaeria phaeospora]
MAPRFNYRSPRSPISQCLDETTARLDAATLRKTTSSGRSAAVTRFASRCLRRPAPQQKQIVPLPTAACRVATSRLQLPGTAPNAKRHMCCWILWLGSRVGAGGEMGEKRLRTPRLGGPAGWFARPTASRSRPAGAPCELQPSTRPWLRES